jgi:hypothetical protein
MDCDYKVVYSSLADAEDGYWRTPPGRIQRYGALLPYWGDAPQGFHLGHFDTLGKRAFLAWGAETYNIVNAYARVNRKKALKARA